MVSYSFNCTGCDSYKEHSEPRRPQGWSACIVGARKSKVDAVLCPSCTRALFNALPQLEEAIDHG